MGFVKGPISVSLAKKNRLPRSERIYYSCRPKLSMGCILAIMWASTAPQQAAKNVFWQCNRLDPQTQWSGGPRGTKCPIAGGVAEQPLSRVRAFRRTRLERAVHEAPAGGTPANRRVRAKSASFSLFFLFHVSHPQCLRRVQVPLGRSNQFMIRD